MISVILNKPFCFIRHGQTDWNLNRIIIGQTDIPLNDHGIQQAQRAVSLFKNLNLKTIISSPLLRARQTAEILNTSLGLPLSFNIGLQERNLGQFQGQSQDKINKNETPSSAESEADFEKRIILTVNNILGSEQELPLIVSHGDFFAILVQLLMRSDMHSDNCMPYFFRPPTQANHSWFVYPL